MGERGFVGTGHSESKDSLYIQELTDVLKEFAERYGLFFSGDIKELFLKLEETGGITEQEHESYRSEIF